MSAKENQHYVPQFLLREFSQAKKNESSRKVEKYIWVYDKHKNTQFQVNINRIASEKGFYDFYIGEENKSVEPILSKLEGATKEAIEKIILHESLSILTDDDKMQICMFVAIQYLRVKKHREIIKNFNEVIANKIIKMGTNPDDVKGFHRLSDKDIKEMTLKSFIDSMPDYANFISNKTCLLFKTPEKDFFISDNPVVMHNDEDHGPYGNIGFGVKGIQIYMPISSSLTLGFWCSSIQDVFINSWEKFEKLANKMQIMKTMNPNANVHEINNILKMCKTEKIKKQSFSRNASNGTPITIPKETVMFMNSNQVKWSHRFVMSKQNNFDLVKKMISDNEIYREGIQITVD